MVAHTILFLLFFYHQLNSFTHQQDEVSEINQNQECGLRVEDKDIEFQAGDIVTCFSKRCLNNIQSYNSGVSILHLTGRNVLIENCHFDFIENWAPFIENSILTILTDPKAKKSENVFYNQYKGSVFNFKLLYKISHIC